MPYQQPKTPRFYIDLPSYNKAIGIEASVMPAGTWLNWPAPVAGIRTPTNEHGFNEEAGYLTELTFPINYVATLFARYLLSYINISNSEQTTSYAATNQVSVINYPYPTENTALSLGTFDTVAPGTDNRWAYPSFIHPNTYGYVGHVSVGSYFDMPHSPDLSLTMSYEMDGVKRVRTKGGSDLIDYKYKGSPRWASGLDPWDSDPQNTGSPNIFKLYRRGRRTWDLSFSHLQGSDMFPVLSTLTGWESANASGVDYSDSVDWTNNSSGYWGESVLGSDDFFTQVIHRTNGGQLPFLFQPDNEDNNNFAICKFDMNTFKFEQVANGIYNISLKIREVW